MRRGVKSKSKKSLQFQHHSKSRDQRFKETMLSGREICVQKLRNAYQRKEIGRRITRFKRVHQTIQRNKMLFANDARFSFKILGCVETKSRFSAYASLP